MSERSKLAAAVIFGALGLFILNAVMAGESKVGLISVIEFLFLTGVVFLMSKVIFKRAISPWLVLMPLAIVGYVSLTATSAP